MVWSKWSIFYPPSSQNSSQDETSLFISLLLIQRLAKVSITIGIVPPSLKMAIKHPDSKTNEKKMHLDLLLVCNISHNSSSSLKLAS